MSSESTAERYLKFALQMNPMYQAQQLIDLRAKVLRLQRLDKSQFIQEQVDVTALRQAARRQIADVQNNFWKMPIDALKQQLEMIDVRRLPDLAPVVGRLRTAAACRGEFPKLSQESWMDLKLLNAFRSAAVLPPTEAAHAREAFLSRIASNSELKKIKSAVKKLESSYPILYAMEHDWFQTLLNHKLRNTSGEIGSSGGVEFSMPEIGWPVWLLVFVLIRAILRLIMTAGGN